MNRLRIFLSDSRTIGLISAIIVSIGIFLPSYLISSTEASSIEGKKHNKNYLENKFKSGDLVGDNHLILRGTILYFKWNRQVEIKALNPEDNPAKPLFMMVSFIDRLSYLINNPIKSTPQPITPPGP